MFIGNKEIKKTKQEGEITNIEFEDGSKTQIHQEVFNMIKSDTEGIEDVSTNVSTQIAGRFLKLMANWNLSRYFIERIAIAMKTLSSNKFEDKLCEKFGLAKSSHPQNILIKEFFNDEE